VQTMLLEITTEIVEDVSRTMAVLVLVLVRQGYGRCANARTQLESNLVDVIGSCDFSPICYTRDSYLYRTRDLIPPSNACTTAVARGYRRSMLTLWVARDNAAAISDDVAQIFRTLQPCAASRGSRCASHTPKVNVHVEVQLAIQYAAGTASDVFVQQHSDLESVSHGPKVQLPITISTPFSRPPKKSYPRPALLLLIHLYC